MCVANVAALDCGSNSTRLLIVDDHNQPLVREMTITRLGQGVDDSGALSEAGIERVLTTLRRYRELMDTHDVTDGLLVATSAVRDAANGAEFLTRANAVVGVPARVISGDAEARYSFEGATASLSPSDTPTLIVDIGGGSTELASTIGGVLHGFSMQLGCVRVTERVLGTGMTTDQTLEQARDMITAELDRAWAAVPAFASLSNGLRVLGLAGTVATLAQLETGLTSYRRDLVHHQTVTRDRLHHWVNVLGAMTPDERLMIPGMVAGRQDVMIAGLLIMDAVMERCGATSFITSEDDILDGVATEVWRRNRATPSIPR